MFNTEQKLEALEWYFSWSGSVTKPSPEKAIEHLEHYGVQSFKAILITLWEKQNDMDWEY